MLEKILELTRPYDEFLVISGVVLVILTLLPIVKLVRLLAEFVARISYGQPGKRRAKVRY